MVDIGGYSRKDTIWAIDQPVHVSKDQEARLFTHSRPMNRQYDPEMCRIPRSALGMLPPSSAGVLCPVNTCFDRTKHLDLLG